MKEFKMNVLEELQNLDINQIGRWPLCSEQSLLC